MGLSKEKIIDNFLDDMQKDGIMLCNINDLNALISIVNQVSNFIEEEFKDQNEDVELGYEIAINKLREVISGCANEITIEN